MNDDERPDALGEVDNLDVGPAPVGDLLHAGHTARRRRTVIASVAAVTVLLVGGGLVSTQVLADHHSTDESIADDDTSVPPEADDLKVSVRAETARNRLPARGGAVWDPGARVIGYASRGGYSGSCPPAGAVTVGDGVVRLTLSTDHHDDNVPCTTDARGMVVTIEGFTEPPAELLVTEDGDERSVRVAGAEPSEPDGATHGIKVRASHQPEGQIYYFEGALEEVRLAREGGSGPVPVRSELLTGSPWTRTWDDLVPGTYTISGAVRPCGGNCGDLDPPTDSCEQSLTLDENLTVDVTFTYGRPCTITVTSDGQAGDATTRTLDLPTNGWQPGDGSRSALINGVLAVDDDDCVYLADRRDPTNRVYATWPAGYTATLGDDGDLALIDSTGEEVASGGDTLVMSGAYGSSPGTEPCLPSSATEVAHVESDVEVDGP